MSTVLAFRARPPRQTTDQRHRALIATFADHRRSLDDVFWLKENAEILNILECCGLRVPQGALDPLAEFYATLDRRIAFFPQYYRFLLSIALDLEALGLPGDLAARLVDWAAAQGLAQAELSDLQRAEARRLMLRRGHDPMARDAGLSDRLRAFTARTETFAVPNKKAAYELTHIVFYLSEYGRRSPDLPPEARHSLHFAGTLAFLDQNADLLAEVCVALRQTGLVPPALWEAWLAEEMRLTALLGAGAAQSVAQDAYHEYLVGNWALAQAGRPAFTAEVPTGRVVFQAATGRASALREMSERLFAAQNARSGPRAGPRSADWDQMRAVVTAGMSDSAQEVLLAAETAIPDFAVFFAAFARAAQPGPQVGARWGTQSGHRAGSASGWAS